MFSIRSSQHHCSLILSVVSSFGQLASDLRGDVSSGTRRCTLKKLSQVVANSTLGSYCKQTNAQKVSKVSYPVVLMYVVHTSVCNCFFVLTCNIKHVLSHRHKKLVCTIAVKAPMVAIMEIRPCFNSTDRRRLKAATSPSAVKPTGSQNPTGACTPSSFSKAVSATSTHWLLAAASEATISGGFLSSKKQVCIYKFTYIHTHIYICMCIHIFICLFIYLSK